MFSYFKGHARLPPVLPEELRVVKVVWSIQVFEKVSRKSKLQMVAERWNGKIVSQKVVVVLPWCNMSSTNKSLNWIPNCIQTTRICRECGLRFRIHRNSKIDTNIASSGFEFLFISLSPFFFLSEFPKQITNSWSSMEAYNFATRAKSVNILMNGNLQMKVLHRRVVWALSLSYLKLTKRK